jgi:hypothetical protein
VLSVGLWGPLYCIYGAMSSEQDEGVITDSIDEEKQLDLSPPNENEFLVQWDGDNDPLNPRSLPLFRKWLIVIVVSMGSVLV